MCFSFLNVFYVSLNWQVVFSQNIGNWVTLNSFTGIAV
jgi:hypothetical protein